FLIGVSVRPRVSLFPYTTLFRSYILGVIVATRFVRRNLKPLLWRLRNRLIVSYLFIAVVPIGLLLALVAIGGYMLMGQVAIYTIDRKSTRLNSSHVAISYTVFFL